MELKYAKIKKSKDYLLEALTALPNHKHRDHAVLADCGICKARKAIKNAYTTLPSNQDLV